MASAKRKLTALVVLPLEYNPDARGQRHRVEAECFRQTSKELAAKFGGGFLWAFGDHAPRGFWWDRGVLYRDEMTVIEIDIPANATAKSWLVQYAQDTLTARFK